MNSSLPDVTWMLCRYSITSTQLLLRTRYVNIPHLTISVLTSYRPDVAHRIRYESSKVVSLYSQFIASRLSTPEKDWITLFGGPKEEIPVVRGPEPAEEAKKTEEPGKAEDGDRQTSTLVASAPGATASLRGYLPNMIKPGARDDETASIASRRSLRRRATMDIFGFRVPPTTHTSAPPVPGTATLAATTIAPTQLSPGRCGRCTVVLLSL